MNKLEQIYDELLKTYSGQGWWPIINDKTLLCEYQTGAPRNDAERTEIIIGCVLAQGTQWYPNVVRALQQLKIGRSFTKSEIVWIKQAEIERGNSRNVKKATKKEWLTQNTAWKNVEKAIANLKESGLIDFKKLAAIKAEKLARLIKPSGYYNQKAKKLKLFAEHVVGNYGGSLKGMLGKGVSELRAELLSLHGIGPETADSIILYAAGKPVFVVDAYTRRIFARMGISSEGSSYDELQRLFMDNLPKDAEMFNQYHALTVELGKNICRKKPSCSICPVSGLCKKVLS